MKSPIMVRRLLGRLHARLGASPKVLRALGKLSNQCEMLRGRQLAGHSTDFDREQWFLERFPGPISTVVDVGANVGDWTAMVAEIRKADDPTFLLYEPVSANVTALEKRFQGNPRVRVIASALGDVSGEASIHISSWNDKLCSFAAPPEGGAHSEVVRVARLDEELDARGIRSIDYLKIDAEGYDLHVLCGAEEAIRSRRVKALQFEYLGGAWKKVRSTIAEALNLLERRCGWRCWLLADRQLSVYDYAMHGETVVSMCFVAVPSEEAERLRPFRAGTDLEST
ncbi:MAG: FkbM family methyltransferase [Chthoniobacterales bacterium]|nr:FkbM family methyltransferase [Chthoniobacterales bacterium]